ncbi:SA1320 family protein [Gemella sanguinis]|uniref:SA1320 family protein n=1 Tax=Gemella sanguinis TaxID=84135 RepID=UPI0028E6B553|nr:Mbeg1-like protein [Gemella sanguinis]
MAYSDETNMNIAKEEYKNREPGYILNTEDNEYLGTLSDVNDDRTNNGEQIYTYTRTEGSDEIVSPDAPLSEREKVEEITILYRGSTAPGIGADNEDARKDWLNNDVPMAEKIMLGEKGATGQLETSSDYLKEMMEKYPNAKINIYGHSLGSMDAQYALANVTDYSRIKSANIYNGPNIYSTLTEEQKINVSALYDKINNYVDSRDLVGLGYKKGEGTVGKTYNFSGESNGINKIDQHMWGGYRFDSDGNLIDEDGKRVKAWNKPDEIKKLQAEAKNKVRDAAINKVQGLSVDVDHDGKLDAQFGRDKLLTTELMPGSGAGKDIVINFSSLQGLSKNLQGLLEDIKQIRELLTKSTTTNSTVESRKANRTETLEQSIVSYLEQINLIKSIKNLDDFYTKLEGKEKLFSEIANYNTYQFSRQFDWFGFSGFEKWCYRSGASWDYGIVTKLLDSLSKKAGETWDTINKIIVVPGMGPGGTRIIQLNTKTGIAQKGEATINSFKKSIGDTLKGEGIRSAFDDGIANPLSDVLKVELTNVDKMEECINSMIGSVNALAESHRNNDATIEQNWRSNQDVMGGYEVGSIPTDFDTFVKKSNLFDDLEVLKAFDQQVDNTTNSLGDSMITAFSEYLTQSKSSIDATHSGLNDTESAASNVIAEFATEICYKVKLSINFYNTVEACISIASSIKEIKNFIDNIEQEYQETIQTIFNTGNSLPSLKTQLRSYLEDAIYNYSTLSDVVKGQRVIASIMNRIYTQALGFLRLVNENKGKSIEALAERMGEMGTMASHISQVVEQCFGSKA